MLKSQNIVVIDADEISSIISQQLISGLNLPYKIIYLYGLEQGLEYLKSTYPIGEPNEPAASKDLLLLGVTLRHFTFLDEMEMCQETDCNKLCILVLTHMLTLGERRRLTNYENIQACLPNFLSTELIMHITANYLDATSNHLDEGPKDSF